MVGFTLIVPPWNIGPNKITSLGVFDCTKKYLKGPLHNLAKAGKDEFIWKTGSWELVCQLKMYT